ncbi:dinuclear metal center protein, YbgI/SA1388 family [Caloramator quimbayensis]|uniref:GTP cyclohydrolase 1 type 2 homolog n=1 Tax=Caloramator quimbayensis TaxID=1147123 RepID=A0A1T4X9B3_9CLOT|nr:Nif3-like dinuclear metal center hexameric protein [Caloramator quimbayensis]SKA86059.1 dinuclear metal center protein, YbgI/SA1388 family [Caloramator quimbayensis]
MPVICKDLINKIEEKYPLEFAEDYDNCGLLIGKFEKVINKILVCLEVNLEVAKEAKENGADMIISHHPLIFKPIKRITDDNYISRIIEILIKNDINLYALHTNFDNSIDGMNFAIGSMLSLKNVEFLSANKAQELYKIAVYVPKSHEKEVREALFSADCGHIGNYSSCSFNTNGIGTFMPLEGTSPYIGQINKMEYVDEVKIETIVRKNDIKKAVENMIKAHPYEEVAYDIYKLENKLYQGSGIAGEIDVEMGFIDFCSYVKERLNIPYLNVSGDKNKKIKKIAVVGGAGFQFYKDAIKKKCDVLLTGDVKHHEAMEAYCEGLNIIDGGHYFTEAAAFPYILNYIKSSFEVDCIMSKINTNPFYRA